MFVIDERNICLHKMKQDIREGEGVVGRRTIKSKWDSIFCIGNTKVDEVVEGNNDEGNRCSLELLSTCDCEVCVIKILDRLGIY